MLPSPDDHEIAPASLSALLQAPDALAIRLVDCREEDEFSICRIEGAELIPLSRFAQEAPGKFAATEDALPVVVYCHHGMRSMHATVFLRQRGLAKVWSLAGGIDLWSRQIDPAVPRY